MSGLSSLALRIGALVALLGAGLIVAPASAASPRGQSIRVVTVPEADRFAPFVVTIHVGDVVEWVNKDTDDHTVVSNDFFTTAGHQGTDHLLPGTDSNGGKPGRFALKFEQPGVFAYYCRFHAQLDSFHQPIAPGPDGGIQDANGNFGTPMNGIITVLPTD